MSRFLAKRLLDVIPVVIGITLVAFALIHLVPGDPARSLLGPNASPRAVASLRQELGLNRPLPAEYWHFVTGAIRLDFGTSVVFQRPVATVIADRASASLLLIAYSLVVAVLIAIPLATIAAVRPGAWFDHAIRVLTTVTFVMPSFWLGLLLVLVVSVNLGLLPTSGYGDTIFERIQSLTLPAVTVGMSLSPLLLRQLRTSLIEALRSEYVEAARVRGLSRSRVILKHAMRNSLTSTVTLLGIAAGVLLSQTVIIENVFGIPGLGSLLVNSVTARDFPMIQALTLLFGAAVVLTSIVTDVMYAALDPRVRL